MLKMMGCESSDILTNKLTDKNIKLLSKQTGLGVQELALIGERFYAICPFGAMNKKEFVNMYSQLRSEPLHRTQVLSECIFSAFDGDCNGAVSLKEFIVILVLFV